MKLRIKTVVIASLMATPAAAEPLSVYARKCTEKLGLREIPGYSCKNGIAASGADFHLVSPNNFLGRVRTPNPNVDAMFLCRRHAGATTGHNGYIVQNQITGDTCFFDALANRSEVVSSPSAPDADAVWRQPADMDGQCQRCHTADAFIVTGGLAEAFKLEGMMTLGRNTRGAYNIVSSEDSSSHFSGWNEKREIVPGCAGTCHNSSTTGDALDMEAKARTGGWMARPAYTPSTNVAPAGIGVYRPGAASNFYLDSDGSRAWGGGDTSGQFGTSGDKPFVLRGPSSSCPELGVERNGMWWTTANNAFWDDADWSTSFTYLSGGLPVSWNGAPGRFANGLFDIDLNNDRTPSGDVQFSFGVSGDQPVIGRWTRGIAHRMGVARAVNGELTWYLDTNGDNRWNAGDTAFNFGLTGHIPFAADFNGDGIDEVGTFGDGVWYVDMNNNFRWDGWWGGDSLWNFGNPGDIPVVSPYGWGCFPRRGRTPV